ncbi:MAG: nitroreductase family protein [Nanoarchaeota archaeon]
MNLDSCIKERRSCKDYLDKEIPLELIGEIIEAASYAPSAGNLQNWSFIVVIDEKKKYDISISCLKQMWMNKSPVFIVICNRKKRVTDLFEERGELYSIQNCAIAAQNIMLKAHELGLGTCWVGSLDVESIRRILKIPEDVVPEAIITLGYPEKFEKEVQREPVELITYFEEWGNRKTDTSVWPLNKQVSKLDQKMEKGRGKIGEFFKNLFKKKQ